MKNTSDTFNKSRKIHSCTIITQKTRRQRSSVIYLFKQLLLSLIENFSVRNFWLTSHNSICWRWDNSFFYEKRCFKLVKKSSSRSRHRKEHKIRTQCYFFFSSQRKIGCVKCLENVNGKKIYDFETWKSSRSFFLSRQRFCVLGIILILKKIGKVGKHI